MKANWTNLNNIYLENNQKIQYIKHKYRQDSETSNCCFYKSVQKQAIIAFINLSPVGLNY
jgi:hypothetical protein